MIELDESLRIYLGGGCNSVVLTSKDKKDAVVVDTKWFRSAKKLREDIIAPNVTIINTHFHLDHARGNALYPFATVISGDTNWKQWDFDTNHSKRPDTILRPGDVVSFKIDDETVHVISMGRAHSANDIVVFFEQRKLIAVGDLVWINMHPVLLDTNGNVASWRRVLDKLEKDFDIATLVPGHCKISNKESVSCMREYFSSITNAIYGQKELSELEDKYKNYKKFPIFASFGRTTAFIRKEVTIQLLRTSFPIASRTSAFTGSMRTIAYGHKQTPEWMTINGAADLYQGPSAKELNRTPVDWEHQRFPGSLLEGSRTSSRREGT
jgi:glyoxylase-like metal-dependent hydrolase (beta-lactamase superfamily II)